MKQDTERAVKIFENALQALDLESCDNEAAVWKSVDLQCLLYNYVKCITLRRGQGLDALEFAKGDAETKKLFSYLAKMNSELGRAYFTDRQASEQKFEEAIQGL